MSWAQTASSRSADHEDWWSEQSQFSKIKSAKHLHLEAHLNIFIDFHFRVFARFDRPPQTCQTWLAEVSGNFQNEAAIIFPSSKVENHPSYFQAFEIKISYLHCKERRSWFPSSQKVLGVVKVGREVAHFYWRSCTPFVSLRDDVTAEVNGGRDVRKRESNFPFPSCLPIKKKNIVASV